MTGFLVYTAMSWELSAFFFWVVKNLMALRPMPLNSILTPELRDRSGWVGSG